MKISPSIGELAPDIAHVAVKLAGRRSSIAAVKQGESGDGDSILWSGLMVSTRAVNQAPALATYSLKMFQETNGRLRRSPFRKDLDEGNSFSRDMALGVCAFYVGERDTEAAKQWLLFLKSNDWNLTKDASDNRGKITPNLWATMWVCFDAPELREILPAKARLFALIHLFLLLFGFLTSPAGYQRHLVAVQLYLRKLKGRRYRSIGKRLLRAEPNNPFFLYVAGEPLRVVAAKAWELSTEVDLVNCSRTEWAWERTTEDKPHLRSMGHDFAFIYNLVTTEKEKS